MNWSLLQNSLLVSGGATLLVLVLVLVKPSRRTGVAPVSDLEQKRFQRQARRLSYAA